MSPIKKRKADGNPYKNEVILSKRVKYATPTHSKPTSPEPAKESSPRHSSIASTSEPETEANGHAPKSFQDLGIIQSLCDACTALGYKVHMSS